MDSSINYDVVVLGGGPAGCATGLALRQQGIEKVLVVESGDYQTLRIGESIPPDTRVLMEQLGILADFLEEKHEPCLGSCASWGNNRLGYNDFLYNPHGYGWHLDRRRFDAFLARKTLARGVELSIQTRAEKCDHMINQEGFLIKLKRLDKQTNIVRARFIVDATGTHAHIARWLGAKKIIFDQLLCFCAYFEVPPSCSTCSQLTVLEAVEYGWWYAAKLPNSRLATLVATDSINNKKLTLHKINNWLSHLKATKYLSKLVAECSFIEGSSMICTAPSFLLSQAVGNGWLAVGDAASAYDPISSQGIYKALLESLYAAKVIAAYLAGNTGQLNEYQSNLSKRYDEYLENRRYFYGIEKRWSDSSFWKRRQEITYQL